MAAICEALVTSACASLEAYGDINGASRRMRTPSPTLPRPAT